MGSCKLDSQETLSLLSAMFSLCLSSSGSNFALKRRREEKKRARNTPNCIVKAEFNPVRKRRETAWVKRYKKIYCRGDAAIDVYGGENS